MIKSAALNWPVVPATIRSGASGSDELGAGSWAALRAFGLLGVLIGMLIELLFGIRVRFMYTYQAGDKYYVGYIDRFVRGATDSPRLFGRASGMTFYVR